MGASKLSEAQLTTARAFTAKVEVKKHTISELTCAFRRILAQPNIQRVVLEAGKPIVVTYWALPLEDDLEERLAQRITPAELLTRLAAQAIPGPTYKTLVAASGNLQAAGLEPSHLIVRSTEVLQGLGYPAESKQFLGMQVVIHEDLPSTLLLVCGAASALGSLADVQQIYGVTNETDSNAG
jgi:hypothetical protein